MTEQDLLKLARHRPRPDDQRTALARAVVHEELARVVRRRTRRTRWVIGGSLAAATLVLAVSWPQPVASPSPSVPMMATVVRTVGTVRRAVATAEGERWQDLRPGDAIADGAIQTDRVSRAALLLPGGTSLRLDIDTLLTVDAGGTWALQRGAVYVDAAIDDNGIVIQTRLGEVRDIGTQFDVRIDPSSLVVRVREGEVALSRTESLVRASAGEALRVGGAWPPVRSRILTDGAEWAWVGSIVPPFEIEGALLASFLDWVSREQGWTWRFADAATAKAGSSLLLHGAIAGLSPEEAIEVVMPTTGLSYRRNGAELIVITGEEPR